MTKRLFLTALSLAFCASVGAQTGTKQKQKTVYVVGTAHLDTNWLWTIQDTIRDHLPKTLNVNFDFFKTYPDYVFSFEGAFHYMLIKEYYPERFAELKDWVKKGRWKVSGSWVDAVDTNMPSPESLIRQTLYGNGFFKKEFNKTSVDVFLPDCFGFSFALPSIAVYCGLKGFSTQKLTWGSATGIPFPVGVWQGVDGNSVVAALDPGSYGSSVPPNLAFDPYIEKRVDAVGDASGAYVDYRYHGTGDTGGGPSKQSVENLEKAIHANGMLKVISTSSDQLYRDLTPAQIAGMPRYNGELVLTTHGTGCYTSQAVMKKWNRQNEQLADAAERAAVVADWLGGAAYPREKLAQAWVRFLWHQFHDDLTGTCIPDVYPFSWNDEVLSLNQFSEVLNHSVSTIASAMNTNLPPARNNQPQPGVSVPLVVYNPLGIAREDAMEAVVTFPGDAPANVRVMAPNGREVPSQVLNRESNKLRILFVDRLLPLSTSIFEVRGSQTPSQVRSGLSVTDSELNSNRYRVRIDANGDVASIYDKKIERELLKSPVRLEMRDDLSVDWPAWEVKYPVVLGAPREYVSGTPSVKIVENGPARVALEITRSAGGSKFVQRVQLTAGDGARVEFPTTVDWHTKGTLLKADFPFASGNPKATYDLGLGTIQRGNDYPEKYEVPAQQWADLTSPDGAFGASVMSDCKYGWDKPSDDHLRLTLLHTPKAGRGYTFQETNDLGEHEFTYAVVGHDKDWRTETQDDAARLNQPIRVFQTDRHDGKLGRSFQLAEVDSPQVALKALKKAENSNEVIVRVFEKYGQPLTSTSIHFATRVLKVREVDGQENPVATKDLLDSDGGRIRFSLKPYQPRSFAVTFAPGEATAETPLSHPVKLPFDLNVVSARNAASVGGFDSEGHAIPAELFPLSTETEGVHFDFGPAAGPNAVVAKGQTIEIPAGATRVYVLAASGGEDVEAAFKVGDASQTITVPSFTGRIAQWTNRIVDGKIQSDQANFAAPFMKTTPIGWLATHRHDKAGKDDLYTYCYLFKYGFDVPKGAHTLTLPNNPNIRVMAVTAVEQKASEVKSASPLYK